MNRYSVRRSDHLECSLWLVVDSEGSVRMNRGQPETGRGEMAVQVTLKVPLSLFRKPLLRAVVEVPHQAGITEAEALHAVAEIVRSGDFNVDVEVKPQ